jgi:hypothetical protein
MLSQRPACTVCWADPRRALSSSSAACSSKNVRVGVCVYVCVCVCARVCGYYVHERTQVQAYVSALAYSYAMCWRTHLHMCVYVCVCKSVFVCMYMPSTADLNTTLKQKHDPVALFDFFVVRRLTVPGTKVAPAP